MNNALNKVLNFYDSIARWGNIILLGLLILFGIINRVYMVIQYQYADYIVEVFLAILALVIVYRIYKKNLFEINKQNLFKTFLIIGIAFRFILAIHDFYNRPMQDSDYAKHEKLGYRIAFEHEFYDFTGVELRNFRQPGLPFIFAMGLLIYNNPVIYAIIMIMFSFGVIVAGFFLLKDLKNIASLFSFAYLCFSPNMLFMASSSNTQLPFFFFLILLFIVLKNYSGKTYQLIIIGAILAAEMYIRFNFLMLFILIPFIMEKYREKNLSYSLGKMSLVYMSFLILYSPWIYRNYMIYGTIRLMPTTGLGLYSSNVTDDYTKAGGYTGVPDSVIKKYNNLSEIEFDNALKKETFDFVKQNPGIYLKGLPFRVFKFSNRQDWAISYFFESENIKNQLGSLKNFFVSIENLFFWIILLIPFIYFFKNKKLTPLAVYILWACLSYSLVLLPLSETRSRYSFPYILFPIFAVALIDKKKL